jgi:hypothetical protein
MALWQQWQTAPGVYTFTGLAVNENENSYQASHRKRIRTRG